MPHRRVGGPTRMVSFLQEASVEERQRDLGEVDEIDVEAIGEPGRRTFRLLLERGATSVCLWMEKEQLEQLALILDQQLSRPGAPRPNPDPASLTLAARFPARPSIEFKVGRLAVGFERERRRFVLTAQALQSQDLSIVSWLVTDWQAETLAAKILAVAAAGRPRCPLCGAPIEGKHVCPLANGTVHA